MDFSHFHLISSSIVICSLRQTRYWVRPIYPHHDETSPSTIPSSRDACHPIHQPPPWLKCTGTPNSLSTMSHKFTPDTKGTEVVEWFPGRVQNKTCTKIPILALILTKSPNSIPTNISIYSPPSRLHPRRTRRHNRRRPLPWRRRLHHFHRPLPIRSPVRHKQHQPQIPTDKNPLHHRRHIQSIKHARGSPDNQRTWCPARRHRLLSNHHGSEMAEDC